MRKKKYVYMYFWVFPIAEMKKKRCEKKKVQKLFWATAQTVSRYNGKLYRDMALWMCSGLDICIATWGSWLLGKRVAIHLLYCDRDECWLGENCVVIQGIVS